MTENKIEMTENKYDLTSFNKVEADISVLKDKGNFIPDCSTNTGYEASKRFCLDYTVVARKALNDAHQKTKAPFLATTKFLDSQKRELMSILENIEAPHLLAYKAHDEEKKQKKAKFEQSIKNKIQTLVDLKAESIGKTPEEIKALIKSCEDTDTEDGFYHFKYEAIAAKEDSLNILKFSLLQAIKAEESAEKIRAAKEKQFANDYEVAQLLNDRFDRDVSDKADRERLETEKKLLEFREKTKRAEAAAAERAKQDEINRQEQTKRAEAAAAERAKQDEIDRQEQTKRDEAAAAERAKQDEIDRQEQEQQRINKENKQRAENQEHVKKINSEAAVAVVTYCDVTQAEAVEVIEAVANGQIPSVTIKY